MKIFALLFFVSLLTMINCNPVKDESGENDDDQNTCKLLCEHCGCKGFYCGEECICECVQDTDEDVQCLETMKSNCDKMDLNFDMVYQGSKGYRFVRESNKKQNPVDNKVPDVLRQQRSIDSIPSEHQAFIQLVDEPVAPAVAAPAPAPGPAAAPAAKTDEVVGAAAPSSPAEAPKDQAIAEVVGSPAAATEVVGSPAAAAAVEDVGMAKSATSMVIPTKPIAFQPKSLFFNKNKFAPPTTTPPPSKKDDCDDETKYFPKPKFTVKNLDIMEALKQGKVVVIAKRPKDKNVSKLGSSHDLVGSPHDTTLASETAGVEATGDTETVGMSKPADLLKKSFINDLIMKKRAKDYAEKMAKANYEISKDKYIIDKMNDVKADTFVDIIKANKIASAKAKKRFEEIAKLAALMKTDNLLRSAHEDSVVGAAHAPTAPEAPVVGAPAPPPETPVVGAPAPPSPAASDPLTTNPAAASPAAH